MGLDEWWVVYQIAKFGMVVTSLIFSVCFIVWILFRQKD